MKRRNFLWAAGAAACSTLQPHSLCAQSILTLVLPTQAGNTMNEDFLGLSYETGQLYNAAFFAPENQDLVDAFRTLTPSGVLRLGGHLSNITDWEGFGRHEPRQLRGIRHGIEDYWEWPLVDPSIQRNKRGLITRQALRNLRGFLDLTGWKLVYGLNFASGSAARAADEAQAVHAIIGPRLLAFVIGNEVDGFHEDPVFRPANYGPAQFLDEYLLWVKTIRQTLPQARFAGPDIEGGVDTWVQPFARRTRGDLAFLTSHYYGMGPASDPAMTAERLLRKETPELDRQIEQVKTARQLAGGLPYRMDEGNSCFGGGRKGVSDAYASSLWAADYILRAAAEGFAGVNLHGGGTGIYTPIESSSCAPAAPRPVYYGMLFAQAFTGLSVARCMVPGPDHLAAYLGTKNDITMLALINKGPLPLHIALPAGFAGQTLKIRELRGPSLAALSGIHFGSAAPQAPSDPLVLAAYSGTILQAG